MDCVGQAPSTLFQRWSTEISSPHNGDTSEKLDQHDSSQGTSPQEALDLEKAETIHETRNGTRNGVYKTGSGRISRIQSSQQRRTTTFGHPLSHVQTSGDVLVEFDGPDDPYRPINWPFRKKVVTTALYGFTTMGSTWASSVWVHGMIEHLNRVC